MRSTATSSACSCSLTLCSSRRAIASALSCSACQLLLDLGDFGAEEALGEGAGEQGDEADADDQDRDRDDLAAGRRRVDVGAERGHRRHRPVDPVPGVEVLAVLLEGDEEGAAADHGQQGEQHRVVQALQREDLARELGEAQQAQQPQQPQHAQALQAGRQHRRGEDDDERGRAGGGGARARRSGTTASITTSSIRKASQVTQLRMLGDVLQRAARVRLADRHHRQGQRRGDQHRRVQRFGHPRAARVHPRRVVDDFLASPLPSA